MESKDSQTIFIYLIGTIQNFYNNTETQFIQDIRKKIVLFCSSSHSLLLKKYDDVDVSYQWFHITKFAVHSIFNQEKKENILNEELKNHKFARCGNLSSFFKRFISRVCSKINFFLCHWRIIESLSRQFTNNFEGSEAVDLHTYTRSYLSREISCGGIYDLFCWLSWELTVQLLRFYWWFFIGLIRVVEIVRFKQIANAN